MNRDQENIRDVFLPELRQLKKDFPLPASSHVVYGPEHVLAEPGFSIRKQWVLGNNVGASLLCEDKHPRALYDRWIDTMEQAS